MSDLKRQAATVVAEKVIAYLHTLDGLSPCLRRAPEVQLRDLQRDVAAIVGDAALTEFVVVPAEPEPERAAKALATLVVHLLEGAKLTPKAYDGLPRVYELIRLIGFEGEPVGAAEAGKAQGWRNPRKDGRPDDGEMVQFWANGNDCASVGFRKGQTWSDLLDMFHLRPQQYDECYVVGWAPLLPAPPTKDPTND